jgi:hypothetical protein
LTALYLPSPPPQGRAPALAIAAWPPGRAPAHQGAEAAARADFDAGPLPPLNRAVRSANTTAPSSTSASLNKIPSPRRLAMSPRERLPAFLQQTLTQIVAV